MPIKLTKKYRNNNKRTKSKRGGGPCTPEKFGIFELTKWGNIGGFGGGGCGFNIYVWTDQTDLKKRGTALRKFWVDVDESGKITKIAEGITNVTLTSSTGGGISSKDLKDPAVLLQIFPWGFFTKFDGARVSHYVEKPTQLTGEEDPDQKEYSIYTTEASQRGKSKTSASPSASSPSAQGTSSKFSGLGAVWELQTNPKYKNDALARLRDPTNPFGTRQTEKEKFIKIFGNNPDCTNVQFGEFKVNRWGNTGGCGFNIWDNTGKKFWIDVDPFFNIATGVKDESNCVLGVCTGKDDPDKNDALFSIKPEENRTPFKTLDFFLKLFPSGYKVTEEGSVVTTPQRAITAAQQQPAITTEQPSTTAAQPSTTAAQPSTTAAQPSTTAAQPSTTAAQPSTTTTAAQPSTTTTAIDPAEEKMVNFLGPPPPPVFAQGGSKKTSKRRKTINRRKQSKKRNNKK